MNAAQAEILNRKLNHLHQARPTIQPNANVQAAGNKPWQVTAPGGSGQIPFPAPFANAVELCHYLVLPGESGALRALVTAAVGGSNFVDNAGAAVWHLTINGASVPGFENITAQLGTFGNPFGLYVTLQENDLLQLWVSGPIYAGPAQPTGFASGLLNGYVCYGGQGTFIDPRYQADSPQRVDGQGVQYTGGGNDGSPPNSAAAGRSYNRNF